jgi:Ras family protein T1
MADIIIYVHDSSDTNSFSYISNLRVSTSPYHLSYADMTATILLRPYPICLCRYEIRSRSRTTTPRSSARYILSSPSLTGANSSLDTRRISHESLGRRHKNGPQPVSPRCTPLTKLTNRHTGMIRGPSSSLSPAQRVRLIATATVAATTLTAVIGVWMRYQGYTFKGIWSWFGRTSLFSSKT